MSLSNEQRIICKKGNLEDILSLVDNGCDKNKILCQICHLGYLDVVKYLVEKCGVDARAKYDYAVRWASVGGHLEVVKYLVEKCGANARANSDYAVKWASENEHLEVVKYLVEKCRAVLPDVNPKYERYLSVCQKGEKKRTYIMVKRIYFWWVQTCYNPDTLCGHRSMYKGYREYLSMR